VTAQPPSPSRRASVTSTLAPAYTATLSTTNQGGCANALIFTGQTAYCNGMPVVHAAGVVKVPGSALASPSIAALTRHVRLAHGEVRITLTCSGKAGQRAGCRGMVTLAHTGRDKHGRTITVLLGRVRYRLKRGARGTITVRLNRRALAMLNHARHHQLVVRATATLAAGPTTTWSLRIRV